MFEIGSSLREARRRQGLELDDVVKATLIRARLLEALEDERFDLLPDGFYRRSFLRRYAEFLGLDGDIYVEEFEQRFGDLHPEPEGEAPRRPGAFYDLLLDSRRPVAILAVLALVGLAVWVLAGSGGSKPLHRTSSVVRPQVHRARPRPVIALPDTVTSPTLKPPAVLTLTAARGRCWLEVRLESSSGATIVTQTLSRGQHISLGLRRRLWIRLGAPWNLDARIGTRSVTAELPASSGNVLAAASGMRPAP